MLNQNVRALDQRHELFAVSVALQIERHACLAAIEHREGRAFIANERRKAPRILASRLLDLEHLGAGFGEHQCCQWSGKQRGKIEDKKAGQRLHGNSTYLASAGVCHAPWAASRIARATRGGQSIVRLVVE